MFTINVFMTVIDEFKQLNLFVFELFFYVIGDMSIKSIVKFVVSVASLLKKYQSDYLLSLRGTLSLVTTRVPSSLGLEQRVLFCFFTITMADEVADSMDKMKLMSEEEEIITISDEGRVKALESCQLSLIGKFLTCKSFNKMVAKNTIRRAWGLDEYLQILEVGANLNLRWIGF